MERRDTIYDNLRDLKFEYRTGNFAEQDYEQMKDDAGNRSRAGAGPDRRSHRQRSIAAQRQPQRSRAATARMRCL